MAPIRRTARRITRAIPLLEELDDRRRLVTSLIIWALQSGFYWSETVAPAALNADEVAWRSARALQLAQDMDWPAGVAFVLYERALWLRPRGQYAAALEAAHRALVIAEEIAHQQWTVGALCALGALHLDLLDTPGARRHLDRALQAARALGSLNWTLIATAVLVPTYLLHGERDGAAAVLDGTLAEAMPGITADRYACSHDRAGPADGHSSPRRLDGPPIIMQVSAAHHSTHRGHLGVMVNNGAKDGPDRTRDQRRPVIGRVCRQQSLWWCTIDSAPWLTYSKGGRTWLIAS